MFIGVNNLSYQISVFAEKCGVNKETIRYYEKKALLKDPIRTDAGYRIYMDEDVKRVKFIKKLQDLGFSLSEIYKLLGVVDNDEVRCKNIFEFVSKKEIEIQEQIADLKRIESMLKDLKSRCPDQKAINQCPIIDSLIFD